MGSDVLAAQRRTHILERLNRSGAIRVSELTELLGVSDMTIRRDLDALERQGLCEKVHGGATAPRTPASSEPGFETKSARDVAEKHAIALAAAELVRPGQAVALAAGTTTWVLAHRLLDVPDLTVATNSIKIADVLRQRHTVVLTGGVRTPSDALVGPIADLVLRSLHFDIAFLGCHGMDVHAGLTTPNLAESETNRAFFRAAGRVVLVADASKYGTIGLSSFADLEAVHVLVTDDRLGAPECAALEQHVGRLIVTSVNADAAYGQFAKDNPVSASYA